MEGNGREETPCGSQVQNGPACSAFDPLADFDFPAFVGAILGIELTPEQRAMAEASWSKATGFGSGS